MKAVVRRTLNQVERVLRTPAGADLWAILSALRGPDQNIGILAGDPKASTIFVRTKAFPRIAKNDTTDIPANFGGGTHISIDQAKAAFDSNERNVSRHFACHIREALTAIERQPVKRAIVKRAVKKGKKR